MPPQPVGVTSEAVPGKLGRRVAVVCLSVNSVVSFRHALITPSRFHLRGGVAENHILTIFVDQQCLHFRLSKKLFQNFKSVRIEGGRTEGLTQRELSRDKQ